MKLSQTTLTLNTLIAEKGRWVNLWQLIANGSGVHATSRISSLKKQGWQIENKIELTKDGMKHSFYRLVEPSTTEPRIF